MILIGFLFLFLILLSSIAIDFFWKKTNYYYNLRILYKSFIQKKTNFKILNLGSTYAKYAFGTYEDLHINGVNFAMNSQSLFCDKLVLEKYLKNVQKGGIVVIPVVVCLMLFDNNDNQKLIKQIFKNHIPQKKRIKMYRKVVKDDLYKLRDIYDGDPCYCLNCDSKLDSLEEIWLKLFGLNDLKEINLSENNIRTIKKNTVILEEIVETCLIHDLKPVIVTPPFSKALESRFSSEFKNVVLYKSINTIVEKYNVLFLDYQRNSELFEESGVYIDGGFCLNKRGSKLFLKKLMNDLNYYLGENIYV